jgi:hypothetical protein
MPQVELTEKIFAVAKKRALDEGYQSVDQYLSDIVVNDQSEEADNFDHLFTPERIAELDRISAEISAGGKTYSIEEVNKYLDDRRKAWLASH